MIFYKQLFINDIWYFSGNPSSMWILDQRINIKGDADFSNGQGPLVALIDVGNAIKSEKKTVHRQLCARI